MKSKAKTVAKTAQDPTIKFANLVIDDVTYKLAWDFNALATAESLTGINMFAGIAQHVTGNISIGVMRALLFACMLTALPDATLKQAGRIMRMDRLEPIARAISEAYTLALPPEEKKSEAAEAASE